MDTYKKLREFADDIVDADEVIHVDGIEHCIDKRIPTLVYQLKSRVMFISQVGTEHTLTGNTQVRVGRIIERIVNSWTKTPIELGGYTCQYLRNNIDDTYYLVVNTSPLIMRVHHLDVRSFYNPDILDQYLYIITMVSQLNKGGYGESVPACRMHTINSKRHVDIVVTRARDPKLVRCGAIAVMRYSKSTRKNVLYLVKYDFANEYGVHQSQVEEFENLLRYTRINIEPTGMYTVLDKKTGDLILPNGVHPAPIIEPSKSIVISGHADEHADELSATNEIAYKIMQMSKSPHADIWYSHHHKIYFGMPRDSAWISPDMEYVGTKLLSLIKLMHTCVNNTNEIYRGDNELNMYNEIVYDSYDCCLYLRHHTKENYKYDIVFITMTTPSDEYDSDVISRKNYNGTQIYFVVDDDWSMFVDNIDITNVFDAIVSFN